MVEYTKNYRKTTGSLWNYYRDELRDDTNDNNSPNKKVINSEPFKYKTSITGSSIDYNDAEKITNEQGNEIYNPAYDANKIGTKEVEIAVPLKYLSNFWKNLDMPLINCEVPLTLTWFANCVITSMEKREVAPAQGNNPAVFDNFLTNVTLKITDTKLYLPVVTLPTEDDNKLLEQLKLRFIRTIKWNKYRSEMTNQTKTNNLNYLIDPTFTKDNRLFVLSFEHLINKSIIHQNLK